MASRRKSTTPCMVPPQQQPTVDSDLDMEVIPEGVEGEAEEVVSPDSDEEIQASDHYIKTMDSSTTEGGYECKYCSFQTAELNLFTLHVDNEHPTIVLNSSYVCVECDFHTKRYDALMEHNARHHPGEDNFTRTMVKRNNQTIFEQTVNDLTFDGSFVKVEDEEETSCKGIALSKTPIMKIKSRAESKKFAAGAHKMAAALDVIKVESDGEQDAREVVSASTPPATPSTVVPVASPAPVHVQQLQQSILVNSPNVVQIKTGANSTAMLPPGTLAQVLSALQNQHSQQQGQQAQQPSHQLLIPVSSIPTYNASMDSNVLLVSAYNRFPYPSVSEIMGLSAQTKFSEEQIKVWFSAQRLKHGVSWTPEEVEEARRKKFNGTVQNVPQTITVIPANLAAAAANGLQSIFQTCQIVGQPGLVLTQVGGGNAVPVASPITLTVAGVPSQQVKASEPTATAEMAATHSPDPHSARPKKSKEQLAELKASYLRRQVASEAEISRLMRVTNLNKRAIKKWFSDTRYNQRNSKDHHDAPLIDSSPATDAVADNNNSLLGDGGLFTPNATIVIDSSDDASDSSPTSVGQTLKFCTTFPDLMAPKTKDKSPDQPLLLEPGSTSSDPRVKFRNHFPDFTPQKFKEKTLEQLLVLEASFQSSETPSDEELSRLRSQTKLTRREVDAWFIERRKIDPEGGGGEKVKVSPSGQELLSPPPASRKIMKKTPQQLHVLKSAFVRSQWPTAEEYDKMAEDTGLPRPYVVNWFGDTRYACKKSNLKWYYLYQSGKVDEGLNGAATTAGGKQKKKKRFRGWTRRIRRPYPPCKRPTPAIKPKTGEQFLREHYLRHKVLNEKDLDELVSKSSMSYEQVREWFAEVRGRVEKGLPPFDEGEEDAGAKQAETEGGIAEMEVKEQGEEGSDEDAQHEDEEGDDDEHRDVEDVCRGDEEEEDDGHKKEAEDAAGGGEHQEEQRQAVSQSEKAGQQQSNVVSQSEEFEKLQSQAVSQSGIAEEQPCQAVTQSQETKEP